MHCFEFPIYDTISFSVIWNLFTALASGKKPLMIVYITINQIYKLIMCNIKDNFLYELIIVALFST